jgi:hypothetical protein
VSIVTLDPTDGPFDAPSSFLRAPRPASLANQTLGIVANGLGIPMFDALAEQLTKWDDLAGTVKVVKPSISVPPWPEQWQQIVDHATVAVTGFGGCGSCSTRSLRDALDLEAVGIPAVVVVHRELVPAVQALARLLGAPDYPFVIVDYPASPNGMWSADEANQIAADILDAVRAGLTR